jgi:hypothetical protein
MVHESFSKRTDVVKQYNTDRESRTISTSLLKKTTLLLPLSPFFFSPLVLRALAQ